MTEKGTYRRGGGEMRKKVLYLHIWGKKGKDDGQRFYGLLGSTKEAT